MARGLRAVSRSPIGVAGAVCVLAILLLAMLAPLLSAWDPLRQVLVDRLQPPSGQHLLGTDSFGRDIFSRALYGARQSLGIVLLVLALTAPFGLLVGLCAGYFGGRCDAILMRVSDVFMAFPRLVLALAVAAALGAGWSTMALAICVTAWPAFARIARAEAVSLRRAEFVLAARTLGLSHPAIIARHILPLCLPAIVVRAALDAPGIVLIAAGLGFLGVGLPAGTPEWGAMVADGRNVIFDHWWVSTAPGLFILVLSLGFNLLGDGLRDVLDPKAR